MRFCVHTRNLSERCPTQRGHHATLNLKGSFFIPERIMLAWVIFLGAGLWCIKTHSAVPVNPLFHPLDHSSGLGDRPPLARILAFVSRWPGLFVSHFVDMRDLVCLQCIDRRGKYALDATRHMMKPSATLILKNCLPLAPSAVFNMT